MIRTPFCDLIGIDVPIMQGAIWPATSPELVAAVSNAGGLGSLGALMESADRVASQIERIRALTDRPFAVNHVVSMLNEEAFAVTLEARPAVISFALGDPGDLVERAHAVGAKVIMQIHTRQHAALAVERNVDAIVAQGSEAGGQGLSRGPSTMVLIPQVVDAAAGRPVLAAGGVADGRGFAAALMLGAQGINIGTRFLASREASVAEEWKQAILRAESDDAVRFDTWTAIMSSAEGLPPTAFDLVPRTIRTPFVDRWIGQPDAAREQSERLRGEVFGALQAGRTHEFIPLAGQTAGLIHDIQPAGEIVRSLVTEATEALQTSQALLATPV